MALIAQHIQTAELSGIKRTALQVTRCKSMVPAQGAPASYPAGRFCFQAGVILDGSNSS